MALTIFVPVVVQIMEEAGGRKNYYRVSIDGKQSFTKLGEVSTDRSLTHIDIEPTSHEDLMQLSHEEAAALFKPNGELTQAAYRKFCTPSFKKLIILNLRKFCHNVGI